jgi:hypothetical protein
MRRAATLARFCGRGRPLRRQARFAVVLDEAKRFGCAGRAMLGAPDAVAGHRPFGETCVSVPVRHGIRLTLFVEGCFQAPHHQLVLIAGGANLIKTRFDRIVDMGFIDMATSFLRAARWRMFFWLKAPG